MRARADERDFVAGPCKLRRDGNEYDLGSAIDTVQTGECKQDLHVTSLSQFVRPGSIRLDDVAN